MPNATANIVEKVNKIVRHDYTNAEKQRLGSELADTYRRLELEQNHLKDVTTQVKSRITSLEATIKEKVSKINAGYEMITVECYIVKDYEDDVIRYVRMDTDDEVDSRDMTTEERQMRIDDLDLDKDVNADEETTFADEEE